MNDYVGEHFAKNYDRYTIPFLCKDGTVYSIQAGSGLYCHPREDLPVDSTASSFWVSYEVWGTTRKGRHITRDPEGWVSRDSINRRIQRHGGPR